MRTPTFDGILAAARVLEQWLPRTPSWSYPVLDSEIGSRVVVKHENVQPIGSFKVRGGLTLMASLAPEHRERGVVSVSTGNHAQSLAYAAGLNGVRATIVMPTFTPANKVDAVVALGAHAILRGASMAEAACEAVQIAERDGAYFVNPGNEVDIIHGHGTMYLELLADHPEIETLYVPIGSGSGAAGAVLVRDALAPHVRVVGVQADGAPAAYRSWREGCIAEAEARTFASGLATTAGFEVPQAVLRDGLDDFLLVPDDDLRHAVQLLAWNAHTLCEGAGAAGLAGALADPQRPGVVGFVCTGGNASATELEAVARLVA